MVKAELLMDMADSVKGTKEYRSKLFNDMRTASQKGLYSISVNTEIPAKIKKELRELGYLISYDYIGHMIKATYVRWDSEAIEIVKKAKEVEQ